MELQHNFMNKVLKRLIQIRKVKIQLTGELQHFNFCLLSAKSQFLIFIICSFFLTFYKAVYDTPKFFAIHFVTDTYHFCLVS